MPDVLASLAFYDQLESDLSKQSDRSLAILSFAFLDAQVQGILEASFVVNNKALFEGTGPLATASAKFAVAHAMGLVSTDERRDLDLLRKIRNAFAHQYSPL